MVVQVVSQIEFAGLITRCSNGGKERDISLASLALRNMRFKADHHGFLQASRRRAGNHIRSRLDHGLQNPKGAPLLFKALFSFTPPSHTDEIGAT